VRAPPLEKLNQRQRILIFLFDLIIAALVRLLQSQPP
jgi:hypothetical protein